MTRRKTTIEKQLSNTYRADRAVTMPAFTPSQGMRAPKWMKADKAAVAEFRRVVAELEKAGTLKNVDAPLVALWASTFSKWRAAAEDVQTNGLTIWIEAATRTGMSRKPIANPSIRTEAVYGQQLLRIGTKLGISAADRVKIPAEPATTEEDPLQRFIREGEEMMEKSSQNPRLDEETE